jgi:hypothetical protein
MSARRQICAVVISVAAAALAYYDLARAQTAKPLDEKDIVRMIDLELKAPEIIANLQKAGITFVVDDAVVDRLKKAGASDAVIESVRQAGQNKPAKEPPARAKAVTYADVLYLLRFGTKEADILKRLEKSPTIFTLDEAQVDELKKAGATDALLAAMQGKGKRGAPNVISEITDFAIILDCSASMGEKTKEGPTKMTVAKRVVTDLIQKIPDGLNLSFIIYGHDRNLRCKAVKVVRPMKALDAAGKNELARVIGRLQPVGATPIALALETAGAELARNNAPSGLVLISDGKETCNGDPTATAAKLAANPNLTFGVNVIGFDVQDDERAALEEIAKAGKGQYYNAENATEFREVVQAVNTRIDVAAKPAAEPKTGLARRAIRLLEPSKLDLPRMKQLHLLPGDCGGDIRFTLTAITSYGQSLRLPSEEKYNLVWEPVQGEGWPVLMVRGLVVKERKQVDVHPEDYVGIIRVGGKDLPKPKGIFAIPSNYGTDARFATQTSAAYGKSMVVPAGTYNITFAPADGGPGAWIEKNVTIKPGEVKELD